MANILEGVRSQIGIARKDGAMWTVAPTTSEANQLMRRVTMNLNVQKETFQSSEIRADQQIADMRHGATQSTGTLNGELSPKTYQTLFEGVMRQPFGALTGLTGLAGSITTTNGISTVVLSTGSTATLKAGMVCKFTGGLSVAGDLNKHFLITGVSSANTTTFTFVAFAGSHFTTGTITAGVISKVGKVCYIPESDHKDYYFAIERLYTDSTNDKSELFYNLKPQNAQVKVPANGMATVDFPLIGTSYKMSDTRQMDVPNAASATGISAGTTGVLCVNGSAVAVITSVDFDINGNVSIADAVVGSTVRPDVFQGTLTATGTLSAHFDETSSFALRDAFLDETEISITVVLPTSSSATADFISFTFPRVKLSSADMSDNQGGLTRSFGFTALKDESSTVTEWKTTVVIQDSQAL